MNESYSLSEDLCASLLYHVIEFFFRSLNSSYSDKFREFRKFR